MRLSNKRTLTKTLAAFLLISHAAWLQALEHAVILLPDGTRLSAELASTQTERELGLMYRVQLPPDRAMLFVYPDSDRRAIWMKNTLISLDVLFLSEQGTIVDLEVDVPPCTGMPCPIYRSDTAARYIVEMNAGTIKRTGLKLGDELTIDYRHDANQIKQDR